MGFLVSIIKEITYSSEKHKDVSLAFRKTQSRQTANLTVSWRRRKEKINTAIGHLVVHSHIAGAGCFRNRARKTDP